MAFHSRVRRSFRLALLAVAVAGLAGCSGYYGSDGTKYPDDDNRRRGGQNPYDTSQGSLFGPGGLTLFGAGDETAPAPDGGGIGVNSYLWRASLDTVSFMPLVSADPFGGVIITDWFSPTATPNERFKVNIFILSRDLRADGVRATVFKQRFHEGQWVDQPVDQSTAVQVENAILTRAREIRIAQGG